jgi:beta-phosphoglucomutase
VLRAVIFDFDGVITDSEVLHFRAFNQVLTQYDTQITAKDYYTDYLGLSDVDAFKLLAEQNRLGPDSPPIETLLQQKKQAFEELAKSEGRIIEGVRDFLEMLKQNQVAMAICSGSLLVEIEMVLEDAQLRPFFEVVVSAEQVKNGKPNPEPFLLTLQNLNAKSRQPIAAGDCIVIEDSNWGLQAAKAAGMHAVAITNSYDAEQLKLAEKIVENLGELSIDDLKQLCE